VERAGSIRLVADGEEVWRKDAPDAPPSPPSLICRVRKTGLELRWKLARRDQDCEVWIRWRKTSRDEPSALLISRGSGNAKLDFGQLPPGKLEFEAVAHDGFHVVPGEAVAAEIPQRPPTVAILHPFDRRTLIAGRGARLHGLATSADGSSVDPEACVWRVNGKEVARGPDVFVTAPPPGEHRVTLVATDEGGKGEATASFRTVAVEREDREGDQGKGEAR
jgi:hypothetical protein